MPRRGASTATGSTGDTAKVPLPSDDQTKAASGPGAAGDHLDALGHHERRIEADAKPADQCGFLIRLRRLDPIEKRLGARARNGAERLDHLVAAHADAIVLNRELPLVGIERDRDARLRIVAEQRRRGDGFVTQPLAGVGGIRDQLAQKNRFLGIDRMHHQLQQLGDIGFERPAFRLVFLSHGHGGIPAKLFGSEMERASRRFKSGAAARSLYDEAKDIRRVDVLGPDADGQEPAGNAPQQRNAIKQFQHGAAALAAACRTSARLMI